jgi:hypothetical protein
MSDCILLLEPDLDDLMNYKELQVTYCISL